MRANNFIDRTNTDLGGFHIIEMVGLSNQGSAVWRAVCNNCGFEKTFTSDAIYSGMKNNGHLYCQNCGKYVKHGGRYEKLYAVWSTMKARCSDWATYPSRRFYYERGIRVCDEWQKSYEIFREWAYANGYKDGLTIDRIDSDGNYCPENCRWITMKEQQNNKRNTAKVWYQGELYPLKQLCEELNLSKNHADSRYFTLKKYGLIDITFEMVFGENPPLYWVNKSANED